MLTKAQDNLLFFYDLKAALKLWKNSRVAYIIFCISYQCTYKKFRKHNAIDYGCLKWNLLLG